MQGDHFESSIKLGHSENGHGESEPLSLHLQSVASLCGVFAGAFGCADEGRACGLLHDLGKLGPPGQKRLQGIGRGVDHWSYGAHRLLERYRSDGVAATFCALGHHQGLGRLNDECLQRLLRLEDLRDHVKSQRYTLSDVSREQADKWLAENGLALPESISSVCPGKLVLDGKAATMADIRMLFSALVDADFLETEAHFNAPALGERYRRPLAPELQPKLALQRLLEYIDDRRRNTIATENVVSMRDDLLDACRGTAREEPDVFTLSAPTGSGKTLAMLAFALEHALRHGLRRIVLVVPYLSIIEQTARVYREIFEKSFGPHYILEHHSLARSSDVDDGKDEREKIENAERNERTRLLSENWDAPMVITTSVQFFESLFSNRPSACRKLHRLAQSVVLFDEVQTFPTELAIPTLATLAHLARRHRCTTVFATATQPAFSHFHDAVQKIGGPGWQPREIVPRELNLFSRAKRTTVHWPKGTGKITWDALADQLAGCERVLCVVNLKKHARALVERLQEMSGSKGLFHLSTNMCPAHRDNVLRAVRQRLDDKSAGPCRLISTQCIEAGVDIDFPVVYRAMGPLEAIAQAAGRCNRNGLLSRGEVHVFLPDINGKENCNGRLYPPGEYTRAAMLTQGIIASSTIDLDCPETFEKYYRGLYDLSDYSKTNIIEAVNELDFEETAQEYRLIKQHTVNLVVPYDLGLFELLREEAHERGLSSEWIQKAQPMSVSVYGTAEQLDGFAEPVLLPGWARNHNGANVSDEWFILPELAADSYDSDLLGLGELPKSYGWIA